MLGFWYDDGIHNMIFMPEMPKGIGTMTGGGERMRDLPRNAEGQSADRAFAKASEERAQASVESLKNGNWNNFEAGQLEVALGNGSMELLDGLVDEDGQVDEIALEQRVFAILAKGGNTLANKLNEKDHILYTQTLQGMERDIEDFSPGEQALIRGEGADLYYEEQEQLMDAPEVRPELRASQPEVAESAFAGARKDANPTIVGQEIPVANVLRELGDTIQAQRKAENAASEARGSAQITTPEAIAEEKERYGGVDRVEFNVLVAGSKELGSDITVKSADEFDALLKDRDALRAEVRNMEQSTGFFSRLFGEKARKIQDMRRKLYDIDRSINNVRAFIDINAGAPANVDKKTSVGGKKNTAGANAKKRANDRDAAMESASSMFKGRM